MIQVQERLKIKLFIDKKYTGLVFLALFDADPVGPEVLFVWRDPIVPHPCSLLFNNFESGRVDPILNHHFVNPILVSEFDGVELCHFNIRGRVNAHSKFEPFPFAQFITTLSNGLAVVLGSPVIRH